ncbi:sigma-70 family RNA polymerase sigma factor [Streptomyces sp. M41]|uniref:sigma-70 family RNA polymerase sigma factor n=1 Tax=Streptomyces sp. M41 TaxID=3059412 RepID=UPI00374D0909
MRLLRPRTTAVERAAGEAFAEMYRRHRGAVLAYARACCRDPHTAEDLTAEAFTQTLRAVQAGAGPNATWRPYLLSVVRHTAAQWMSTSRRVELSQDFHAWAERLPAPGSNVEQVLLESEDRSLVLRAFHGLPERWQLVLWHTEVERESAEAVGTLLGITPSGVSSLAQRAREGLREAYLQAHLARMDNEVCRPFSGLLAAAVRRSGVRRSRAFERHVAECPSCASALAELTDINDRLGSALPAGLALWGPGYTPTPEQGARAPGTAAPAASNTELRDRLEGGRVDQDNTSSTPPDETGAPGDDARDEAAPAAASHSHPKRPPTAASRAAAAGIAGLVTAAIITSGSLLASDRPSGAIVSPDAGRTATAAAAATTGSDERNPPVPAASRNPITEATTRRPLDPQPPGTETPATRRSSSPSRSSSSSPSDTPSPVTSPPQAPGPLFTIPKTSWSLLYADSEEFYGEAGAASNAFDSDPNTIWHTAWYYSNDELPHEIQIDLGATYELEGLTYLPRQDGNPNGTIGDYKIYVSTSHEKWGEAVTNGAFSDTSAEQSVSFAAKTGRYVRLVALTEAGVRGPWSSVAEISLTGRDPAGD